MGNLVELGTCKKAHGVRGGLCFHLFNQDDSVLAENIELVLKPLDRSSGLPKAGKTFSVKSVAFGNKVIVYLDRVESKNHVDEIVPFSIYVDDDIFPDTEEDEFYFKDLVGLDAYSYNGDRMLGKVEKYYDNGRQVVLCIRLDSGKLIDVLFIDEFVPKVSLDVGRIYIILPEMV